MNQRAFCVIVVAIIAIAGTLPMTGCNDDPETGRLHLVLADAPYPVDLIDSAQVTIEAISVHVTGDESGWHDLPFSEQTFDLLDLQNGVTAELVDAQLPTGSLNEIRLLVSAGRIVLTDAREFDLTVPSGSSSGLKFKVHPPIGVEGNATSEVLLDMDVSQSFLPTPASPTKAEDIQGFFFKPVVRVANLNTTGSVAGYVLSDLGTPDPVDDEPIVEATVMIHSGQEATTAFTNDSGYYEVPGLQAGTWQVDVEADGHAPGATSVQVVPGTTAEADSLRLALLGG